MKPPDSAVWQIAENSVLLLRYRLWQDRSFTWITEF